MPYLHSRLPISDDEQYCFQALQLNRWPHQWTWGERTSTDVPRCFCSTVYVIIRLAGALWIMRGHQQGITVDDRVVAL